MDSTKDIVVTAKHTKTTIVFASFAIIVALFFTGSIIYVIAGAFIQHTPTVQESKSQTAAPTTTPLAYQNPFITQIVEYQNPFITTTPVYQNPFSSVK